MSEEVATATPGEIMPAKSEDKLEIEREENEKKVEKLYDAVSKTFLLNLCSFKGGGEEERGSGR